MRRVLFCFDSFSTALFDRAASSQGCACSLTLYRFLLHYSHAPPTHYAQSVGPALIPELRKAAFNLHPFKQVIVYPSLVQTEAEKFADADGLAE